CRDAVRVWVRHDDIGNPGFRKCDRSPKVCHEPLLWLSAQYCSTTGRVLSMEALSCAAARAPAWFGFGSCHRDQIMRDHTPADVPFKAHLPFINGASHAEAIFERADACLNDNDPTLSAAYPALTLPLASFGADFAAAGKHRIFYAQSQSSPFIGTAPKPSIGRGQFWRMPKKLLMLVQSG